MYHYPPLRSVLLSSVFPIRVCRVFWTSMQQSCVISIQYLSVVQRIYAILYLTDECDRRSKL
jgi:hypothetical protein